MFRERERDRERERETKQTKAGCSCQSHVALPVFLSPVDEQESTLTNENKTETLLPPFDSTSHVRLSFLVNWQDMITVWMTVCLDGNGNLWTRSPMLRLDSNFSTASRQATCLEQERSGDRMFVRTTAPSLQKKSRMATTWSGKVRHNSSKLKKHNENSRNLLVERQLQKASRVRTHWKCMHCHERK